MLEKKTTSTTPGPSHEDTLCAPSEDLDPESTPVGVISASYKYLSSSHSQSQLNYLQGQSHPITPKHIILSTPDPIPFPSSHPREYQPDEEKSKCSSNNKESTNSSDGIIIDEESSLSVSDVEVDNEMGELEDGVEELSSCSGGSGRSDAAQEMNIIRNLEGGIPIIPVMSLNSYDMDSAFVGSRTKEIISKRRPRKCLAKKSHLDSRDKFFSFPYNDIIDEDEESKPFEVDVDVHLLKPNLNLNNHIPPSDLHTWFSPLEEPTLFNMDISPSFPMVPMSVSEENVIPDISGEDSTSLRKSVDIEEDDNDNEILVPHSRSNNLSNEGERRTTASLPGFSSDSDRDPDNSEKTPDHRNGISEEVNSICVPQGCDEGDVDVKWLPPDGGWGWMVLLGSMIVNILIPGMVKSYGVLFIEFLEVFNATPASAAWIPALSYWLYSSMGPFASALAIRYSHRKVTILGGVLASAGLALSYFATSVSYLYVSYGIIGGLGAGLAYPMGVFMVGDYFDKKRGLANGLCTSGSALGSVLIPPLLRALLNAYGYRIAILIMAGILLNVCLGALFYDPVEKHLRKVVVPREISQTTEEPKITPAKQPNKSSCIEIQDKKVTREIAASLPIAIPKKNNVEVRDLRDRHGSGSIRRATFQIGHETPQGESWSLKSMDGSVYGTSPLAMRLMKEDYGAHGSSPRTLVLRNRQVQNPPGVNSLESTTVADVGDNLGVPGAVAGPPIVASGGQSRLNLTAIPEDDDNDNESGRSEREVMLNQDNELDGASRNIDWKYFQEIVPSSQQRHLRLSIGGGNQLANTSHGNNTSGLSRTLSVASNVSSSSFHYVSTIHHGSLLSAIQADHSHPEFPSTLTLKSTKERNNCCSGYMNPCGFRNCKTNEMDRDVTDKNDKVSVSISPLAPPPKSKQHEYKKIIDFSLFKDGIYIIMLLSNSTTAVGYTNFIILLPAYALELGFDKSQASLLLSVVAGFDFFGRIGGAALSDLQFISRKWFYIVGLFFSGVALSMLPMANEYGSLCIYCACFGLASGTYVGVTAVILADELGSEKLGSSYGITLFVNGVFQLAGPPICGVLLEPDRRYRPILTALGIILVIGALFWLAVPFIEYRRKRIAKERLLAEQEHDDSKSNKMSSLNHLKETSMSIV